VIEYPLLLSVAVLFPDWVTYGTFQFQDPFELGLVVVKFSGWGVIPVALFL
jgi:hypothetical protein